MSDFLSVGEKAHQVYNLRDYCGTLSKNMTTIEMQNPSRQQDQDGSQTARLAGGFRLEDDVAAFTLRDALSPRKRREYFQQHPVHLAITWAAAWPPTVLELLQGFVHLRNISWTALSLWLVPCLLHPWSRRKGNANGR
jgi:hypothetical protein